ncbi:hypothetical protein C5F59_036310 [Streptomyces sp. QL37]|uniref:hypothetical protein n=1 Tax=Streptomyces sp. QL37 TaxID=2093747 RepID=UPI0021CB2D21|nr:hypothetical protein [Streptomyces sp. QL37]
MSHPRGPELTDRVSDVRSEQERELPAGLGHAERRRLTALLETLANARDRWPGAVSAAPGHRPRTGVIRR